MTTLLRIAERRARYLMGFSALLMLAIMLAFNAGLISRSASYSLQSWYLVNTADSYRITTEYADESTCRRQEQSSKMCRSGAAMTAQALQEQKATTVN
jgi:hypothetical protein